jgi:hypothetical protein
LALLPPIIPPDKNHKDLPPLKNKKKETAKAEGHKIVNITITIHKLVEEIEQRLSTVGGTMQNMKELVTDALIGAVTDSQIIAGQ